MLILTFMLNHAEKTLLYSNYLWFLAEGMLGPLFAVFALRIGGNILNISWAMAAFLFMTGIITILVGKLCDKGVNQEKVLVTGFALNAVFTFSYTFVSNPLELMIVQACLGISAALTIPTWYALYAKHESRKHDALTWGVAKGGAYFITGIAILLGGYISNAFGFRTLFIVMSIVQVISTVYLTRILTNKRII